MSISTSLLRLSVGLSIALTLPVPAFAFTLLPWEIPETPVAEWTVKTGDSFLVDVDANIGYLIHANGGYTSFPVVTGQRKYVNYIGRLYKASTPTRTWVALSKEVKGDRTTFGPEGTFLRLTYDYEETPYGIHSHRSADKMLASEMRYRSMGCIIVSTTILDVIVSTFEKNEGYVNVVTVNSLGDTPVTYDLLKERIVSMK